MTRTTTWLRRGLLALALAAFVAPAAALASDWIKADTTAAEKTVADAFRAALADNFEAYVALVHPDEKATPRQVSALKKYSFKRFTKQARWYLSGDNPASFKVVRSQTMGKGVRLYLADKTHEGRMPVPIRLEEANGSWTIRSNSL